MKKINMALKICWVCPSYVDKSLCMTSQIEILQSLSSKGHDCTFIALKSANIEHKNDRIHLLALPLKFVPVLSPLLFTVFMSLTLPFYIAYKKPDVIIFGSEITFFASIPSLFYLKITGSKLILDIRSTPVESLKLRNVLPFILSVNLAKKIADGITIITPTMRHEVAKQFNLREDLIGVWTSGVATEHFNPDLYTRFDAYLRKKLHLDNKFVVFYHGSLSENRGLIQTIQAMKLISKKYPDIVFFMLGSGLAEKKLKKMICDENLSSHVYIHSAVHYRNVPLFISMSDVCIIPLPDHPFWRNQSPLKLLEYLAMNKVVLATDIAAHRQIIGDSKSCIYISSAKPQNIAEAIAFAYKNKDSLHGWGKTGRTLVKDNYSWESVSSNLETYIFSIKKVS